MLLSCIRLGLRRIPVGFGLRRVHLILALPWPLAICNDAWLGRIRYVGRQVGVVRQALLFCQRRVDGRRVCSAKSTLPVSVEDHTGVDEHPEEGET